VCLAADTRLLTSGNGRVKTGCKTFQGGSQREQLPPSESFAQVRPRTNPEPNRMNAIIRIVDPHLGQRSGSVSQTCLIRAAQPFRTSRPVGGRAGSPVPGRPVAEFWLVGLGSYWNTIHNSGSDVQAPSITNQRIEPMTRSAIMPVFQVVRMKLWDGYRPSRAGAVGR
jgi:hypothetical protein